MTDQSLPSLSFVTCISRLDVAQRYLLASPCLGRGGYQLATHFNAPSAAHAFNAALDARPGSDWLVWLHQDVFLPQGWDTQFRQQLALALAQWPQMAVAGVYGLRGCGTQALRLGRVLDRGQPLCEPAPLPQMADSLDELLLAVRVDSSLRMDAALGFDFYATDLVLQAQQRGLTGAVLDAWCEHWSDTPKTGPVPHSLAQRILASAEVFERKWATHLPITTPCFHIAQAGDVRAFATTLGVCPP